MSRFSDGLIVTLVAVFKAGEADGKYVTLSAAQCAPTRNVERLGGRYCNRKGVSDAVMQQGVVWGRL